jgi:NAD(P)-dependent dehydrogenase (short-subunit alcohol dehydrogenase family)
MKSVKQKTIIIAGASSGIGAALTRALAQDGHRLYICARRVDRLAEVAEGYFSVVYSRCDVGVESDVQRFIEQVKQRAGSVDVLIYCVGVFGPIGRFTEADSNEWFGAVRSNLFGAFLMSKHVVPLMRGRVRPRILMMSGGGAFDPTPRVSAYGVSKAAIIRLVETLAVELAPDIAVNAVAPGFLATEIHNATLAAGPVRGGEHYQKTVKLLAEDAAPVEVPIDCIRYMISDASAKMSGKTISARFDPWRDPAFSESLDAIMASPLYTTQRTTPAHLKASIFQTSIAGDPGKIQPRIEPGLVSRGRRST